MSNPVPPPSGPPALALKAFRIAAVGILLAATPLGARAQEGAPATVFAGGVPTGEATADEISLSLNEAIERGLRYNLGAILGGTGVEAAEGSRLAERADLLPQVRAGLSETRLKINLAAYGFHVPGTSDLVGPFNVFDARAYVQQKVLDLQAIHRAHAARESLDAAHADQHSARDLVVLACGQLYLEAVAGESRIAAARAELETGEALLAVARDRRASGLGAGIEVLRAQVQRDSQRQRVIVAEQEAAKEKLVLARAIGLPLGQRYRLADRMPAAPALPLSVEEAVARAWRDRPDLRAADARVEAAEESRKATRGKGLPTLVVSGDYGAIGNDVPGALGTFTLGAALNVPVFEGGRVDARVREAEARLRAEQARRDDLRARIYYEVQAVFLDMHAAEDRLRVSEEALDLARQQLQQSRDRFAAGVTDNVEVVQAQESLAAAEESQIAALYASNLARLSLARALGGIETSYTELWRGIK
jgi:outer membrane protein TolC